MKILKLSEQCEGEKKKEKKKDKFKSYSPLPVLPINLFLKYFS